jgi:hypothetical protein
MTVLLADASRQGGSATDWVGHFWQVQVAQFSRAPKSRCTAPRAKAKAGIRPLKSLPWRWSRFSVTLIPKRIYTSHVERQNLTIRMQMRRLTRLTNAFSKKWENLWAAYCLHFAYYNFCRLHKTIRVTPAIEAGITDHVWELKELLA